jgi:site-specific DNA-methyltransferase (adenine-specific)
LPKIDKLVPLTTDFTKLKIFEECMTETLYKGDCLIEMNKIADKSVDMILCDLPYGIVNQKWDIVIPFDKMWEHYKRIIKDKGAIVLFGTEPFSSELRCSNLEMYRYDWIWDKTHCSNFQTMNYQPGRQHELICVFSKAKAVYTSNDNSMNYYPQKTLRDKPTRNGGGLKTCKMLHGNNMEKIDKVYYDKHPTSILDFKVVPPKQRLHPTQKPEDLIEFLIKSYTQEGDIVLDNCMGSGTTGLCCKRLNRDFVGIEKEQKYYEIAQQRIKGQI